MSSARTSTLRILVLALVMSVLVAVPAAAGTTAQTRTVGCFDDPTGDSGGVDAADLTEVCVNHRSSGNISVTVATVGPIDPVNDAAWANDDTGIAVMFSTNGDNTTNISVHLQQDSEGTVVVFARDSTGAALSQDDCEVGATQGNVNSVVLFIDRECLGNPPDLRTGAMISYEETEGAAVAMDLLPDTDLTTLRLPAGDSPPFCDVHEEEGVAVAIARLRCGGLITGTEPISQAVAISQFVFNDLDTPEFDPYRGAYAVIVRDDNFADALAGSSLGFGQGPLLFTYSPTSGPALGQDHTRIAPATLQELLRTVPRGFPVYVLGGTAAIDPGVVDHLTELGYDPIRLAGASREGTAVEVAREVRRLVVEFAAANSAFVDTNMVMIANRDNWPDAVLAGQLGSFWGFPILLTSADSLHPDTAAMLDELAPNAIQLIGGSSVLTSRMLNEEIRSRAMANGYGMGAPGEVTESDDESEPWRQFCARRDSEGNITERFHICRQGGVSRVATAAAVSQFGREMIQRFGGDGTLAPDREVYATGVPLGGGTDSDNYAYVLAASMFSGRFGGAVFLPTDQSPGAQEMSPTIKASVCDLRRGVDTTGDGMTDTPFIQLVELATVMADVDKLDEAFEASIRQLIEGDGCDGFLGVPAPAR